MGVWANDVNGMALRRFLGVIVAVGMIVDIGVIVDVGVIVAGVVAMAVAMTMIMAVMLCDHSVRSANEKTGIDED